MPSVKDRYFKNVHVTLWHVDESNEADVPSGKGVAFGANWTFYQKFMPFFRAGWSDGDAPLMNKTATFGFIHRFHKSDLLGLGFNWGDPSSDGLMTSILPSCFTGSSSLRTLHSRRPCSC